MLRVPRPGSREERWAIWMQLAANILRQNTPGSWQGDSTLQLDCEALSYCSCFFNSVPAGQKPTRTLAVMRGVGEDLCALEFLREQSGEHEIERTSDDI